MATRARRRIVLVLVVILAGIQFIRPTRNVSDGPVPNEIGTRYNVPDEVHTILVHSCYDCHSNNTVYPWYVNIQPAGWWIQSHVNEAKHHLNFSEFAGYSDKKAKHEFEEIEDAATNGWMPITSYTLLHRSTILSPEQSRTLAAWASKLK